ncbi:RNI-like protein [Sparassis crispa]|uniref:RNI-like protein n=1 Tax=Sparassis crispa TaxID=139825 RepID=A0A401GHL5_9APHY|nr:RNI-like protein [Sparassis crispa]GBE81694.1 RNI-like protein [Sparassis crispa]
MATQVLPEVGTRLNHLGFLGTVRFVGAVGKTSGVWLGVEWDDPQRGKHDGVKDGSRYFTCIVPNSGSFIRPSAAISYGTSFLTALVSKYVELPRNSDVLETVVLGSSHGAIEVEAVGLDKIRGNLANLERLREVSLDDEGVSSADPPWAIRRTCPGIRGLDMSKNLIPTWDIVASIVTELPLLQRLALNQNRLRPPQDIHLAAAAFRALRELQLSSTMTTWEEMQEVISYMPALRLIEMGYNNLQAIHTDPSATSGINATLEVINLDSNAIRSWSNTCQAVGPYSGLQRVVLGSNCIETIPPLDTPKSPVAHLNHISFSFNLLNSWRDIDTLTLWCPQLESLTLTGNPLVEDPVTGKNARQFAIAKIPSLLVLDAAVITAKERTDSELFYMSHIAKFGPTDENEREREHPRWRALCLKHGKPDNAPVSVQQRQDTLSNRLIEINVRQITELPTNEKSMPRSPDSADATRLRVLPNMSVRTFRMKVIKSLKIARAQHSSVRLWLSLMNGDVVEMDNDTSDLAWWGLEDGSTIVMYVE